MKRGNIFLLLILLIIISLSSINALIISEVESNPPGKDSKNEWIELYSQEGVNEEYKLVNNDGDELKIKFNFKGYHIYIFNTQWLDNSDEKVYLYDSKDVLIDQTNLFDDGEDSDFTWQRCDSTWVFQKETKGAENCVVEETPETEEPDLEEEIENTLQEDSEEELEKEEKITEKEPENEEINKKEVQKNESNIQENSPPITAGIIKLDSKDIKSKGITQRDSKNKLATIGLIIITIALLFLLVSQRYKYSRKNEFR